MSTEINPENEQFIEIAVANGDFESRDDVLNEALQMLREYNGAMEGDGRTLEMNASEWVKEFRTWVASHNDIEAVADDSRESIYAGRGE